MTGFLTPKQFASRFGVHHNTVYFWLALNAIPHEKIKINIRHRYRIPLYATPPRLKSGPPSQMQKADICNIKPVSHSNWDKIQNITKILAENQISIDDLQVL